MTLTQHLDLDPSRTKTHRIDKATRFDERLFISLVRDVVEVASCQGDADGTADADGQYETVGSIGQAD